MEEIKLGAEVIMKETLMYDYTWTATFIEGDKIYCTAYIEDKGYQTIIVDRSLLRLDVKPQLEKR